MDDFIKQCQQALIEKGYEPGPVDGICGSQTRQAILAFQTRSGLEADGMVGSLTMKVLFENNLFPSIHDNKQLGPHFTREEFRCCCQGRYCSGFPVEMDQLLIAKLEDVRCELDSAIFVTSGVRCVIRNREVGGIDNSRHLSGKAVDCYAPGFSVYQLKQVAENQGLSVILYEEQGFCHLQL